MKAIIGLNENGSTLLYSGDDEGKVERLKEIARKTDIGIKEIEVSEEDITKLMQDNSYIDKIEGLS